MDRASGPSFTRRVVRKALKGDQEAYAALVRRYTEPLETLIRLRLGPALRRRLETEDLLQETYLHAFDALSTFEWRGTGSFFRWLGDVAEHTVRRHVRDHLQTERRAVDHDQSLDRDAHTAWRNGPTLAKLLGPAGVSPSTAKRREERFERLEAALYDLHPDYREVIILARIRELSIQEIARTTGRTPEAITMLLLRALRQLKSNFGKTDSLNLPPLSLDKTAVRGVEARRLSTNGSSHNGKGPHRLRG